MQEVTTNPNITQETVNKWPEEDRKKLEEKLMNAQQVRAGQPLCRIIDFHFLVITFKFGRQFLIACGLKSLKNVVNPVSLILPDPKGAKAICVVQAIEKIEEHQRKAENEKGISAEEYESLLYVSSSCIGFQVLLHSFLNSKQMHVGFFTSLPRELFRGLPEGPLDRLHPSMH